jgi:outer membrane protein assembly factor BamB
MARRMKRSDKRNKSVIGAIAVLAAVAIMVYIYLAAPFGSTYTHVAAAGQTGPFANAVNQSWGDAGVVHQYDGGANHTYYVNKSIGTINISLNDTIMGPITIYKGLLLVSTAGPYHDQLIADYKATHGSVAAIDAYTGKLIWRTDFPNQIIDQPVTVGNTVIVAMGNNMEIPPPNFTRFDNNVDGIYALNLSNGKILWNASFPSSAQPTPAFYNGRIFEPDIGFFMIFNATTGAMQINTAINLPVMMSSPLLVNGTVYFGAGSTDAYTSAPITGNFFTYAVNATTGNIIWEQPFPEAGAGMEDVSPVMYRGILVTGYLNHSMYTNPTLVGLNATTGKTLWTLNEVAIVNSTDFISPPGDNYTLGDPLTEPTMSAMTLWNGIVYSDSNYLGMLFAVNATTGSTLWVFHTGQCESNPNIHDGVLYIMNDGGALFVINATTGQLIKQIPTGMHHLSNQVTITKNEIVLPSLSGRIYSIPINSLLT